VLGRTLPLLAAALTLAAAAPPLRADTLPRLRAPDQLRVVSYYPSTGGWNEMWDDWQPEQLQADFARIAGLHANTVRLILQAGTFGFPQPSPVYTARLAQAVDLAAQAGLHVQLTLFDWLGQHGLGGSYADVAGSEQWASAVLGPYVGDSRVACVELQNELDPRDPAALAWARTLLPYVQGLLGKETPVTLSAGGDDPVANLQALVSGIAPAAPDFWTLHLFSGGGERAFWQLRAAMKAVAPRKLWLGETGYATEDAVSGYSDLPPTDGAQEEAQVHYLKTTAEAAYRLGLPPIGVWILDDFAADAIPGGPVPPAEYHFGLFRTDGTPKPAAALVRDLFATGRPPLGFDNGFEGAVADGTGGSLPAEWSADGDANMEELRDTTTAHTGEASALVRSRDGTSGRGYFFAAPVDAAALQRAIAIATVWVRVRSPGADVRIGLDWLDGKSQHLKTIDSAAAPSARGWVQLRVRGRRPDRARSVRLYLKASGTRGSVWFDDVSFSWR
jgi:hypothetical protein